MKMTKLESITDFLTNTEDQDISYNEVVAYLVEEFSLPRPLARTLLGIGAPWLTPPCEYCSEEKHDCECDYSIMARGYDRDHIDR